jgi:hypothetical protein
MMSKLERVWEEVLVAQLEGLRKITENVSQDSSLSGRYSNPGPPAEY